MQLSATPSTYLSVPFNHSHADLLFLLANADKIKLLLCLDKKVYRQLSILIAVNFQSYPDYDTFPNYWQSSSAATTLLGNWVTCVQPSISSVFRSF